MQTDTVDEISSARRKKIALTLFMLILCCFWFLSRYPDLIAEYQKSEQQQLIDRNTGSMTKDEILDSKALHSNLKRAWITAVNWVDANKIGMSFGLFFSAAILLLLEQSLWFKQKLARPGYKGILSGTLVGTPLGVCTNCATPVSLGLRLAGASQESTFASLVASPSLNPVGLIIIFSIFPWVVGISRVISVMIYLLVLLPLAIRISKPQPQCSVPPVAKIDSLVIAEPWTASLKYCAKQYLFYLLKIITKVVPPMLIIGLLAALAVAYFPLEKLLIIPNVSWHHLILASVFGVLLPMPMFVDIVLVWMMMEMGLPLSLSVVLMITLAPTSLLALYVMAKQVNLSASIMTGLGFCALGIIGGLVVSQYTRQQRAYQDPKSIVSEFKPSFTYRLPIRYDHNSLKNFFGGGVSLIDYDKDGLIDIFLPAKNSSVLLKNLGNMHFKNVTDESGIKANYNTVAGIWADYNNDGYLDLLMVNYQDSSGKAEPNILYMNMKNGHFKDVTVEAGLQSNEYSSSAAWADFDNDGDLDLFISNYGKLMLDKQAGQNKEIIGQSQTDKLYRNDSGRFVEISKQAGVAGRATLNNHLRAVETQEIRGNRGFSFQPLWFDFNNDGWVDLLVAADFGTSQLYLNLKNGQFRNVTSSVGLDAFNTGMGISVFDFNQDGFFDLLITTTAGNKLWVNQSGLRFKEQGEGLGLNDEHRIGWGVLSLDANNDGKEEVLIANGSLLQSTLRGTEYQKTIAKISSTNQLFSQPKQKFIQQHQYNPFLDYSISRGMAKADLDNDGLMDVAISNRNNENLVVYANNNFKQNYIKISLSGITSNTFGIGAVVIVYTGDNKQSQLITAGSSFLSQSSNILHFGLGQAQLIDKIVVIWPGGKRQQITNINVNQLIDIKESIF